jgi:predicted metal-binding membrane protein
MLLAFVGGTMNLFWMGLATGLMILEKLPAIGRPMTKP